MVSGVTAKTDLILIDWLTVSFADLSPEQLLDLLGLRSLTWETCAGSKLHYMERFVYRQGITIHYTRGTSVRYNEGCCFECSGSGCRVLDDLGALGCADFLTWALKYDGKVTRLDLAFDDHTGVIPLHDVAAAARSFEYTATSKKLTIAESADMAAPDRLGVSVSHGSRSSTVYIRIYDKRAERGAWDDCTHWVRCEIQLRAASAHGAAQLLQELPAGQLWAGIVRRYVQYRQPVEGDSNKDRWPLSQWYSDMIGSAESISVYSKCDREYNRGRLDGHIYERNHNAVMTELLCDGVEGFVRRTVDSLDYSKIPDKYKQICGAMGDIDKLTKDLLLDMLFGTPEKPIF